MNLTFLQFIILLCLERLRGERTIYSIYHLLTGKKSAQTIQDGTIFHLIHLFKTYDELTREQLDDEVEWIHKHRLIVPIDNSHFQLTSLGKTLLEDYKKKYSFLTYLDGWRFEKAITFWHRLSLLVQAVSNMNHGNSRYFPIQKDKGVQIKIKQVLKNQQKGRIGNELHQELVDILEKNKLVDPSVLVIRFTGFESIGLTKEQASDFLKLEKSLYHYQFFALLHFILRETAAYKQKYPLLYQLSDDLFSEEKLTATARKTYELLQKGYSIDEIAASRNLKENTIYDHIVEIAMQMTDFSITPFVDERKISRILTTIENLQTKKLKRIYEMTEDVTYFEIRLVLAKYGDKYGTID